MSLVIKDSYKADVFKFDLERYGSLINFTINNAISWEWMKMKLTKEELKGLSDFINNFLEEKND
jgi:hypothetical protein